MRPSLSFSPLNELPVLGNIIVLSVICYPCYFKEENKEKKQKKQNHYAQDLQTNKQNKHKLLINMLKYWELQLMTDYTNIIPTPARMCLCRVGDLAQW